MENKIKLFESKQVRAAWDADNEEWYFSVVDIVSVLTDNDYQTARKYWNKLRQRLSEEGSELVTNCHRLKMGAFDGKMRETDVLDTKAFCASSNRFPARKPNRSRCGLLK